MNRYVENVREVALKICSELGFEMFSTEEVVENGMKIIQVLVDGLNSSEITIDDVTKVIEKLQEVVERDDLIPDDYFLEVSSVGVERPLRTKEEMKKAIGEYIYIELFEQVERNNSFYGTLENVDDGDETIVVIKINCKGRIKTIRVKYENISFARIAIKF